MQIHGLTNKNHRTALVIDGEKYDSNEAYAERIKRLLQSLNGENIKTDVFTLRNGALHYGAPSAPAYTPAAPTGDVATQLKSSLGYDLVLTSA